MPTGQIKKITIDWRDILRELQVKQSSHTHCQTHHEKYTVGYATTNDPTTNECYNEQFLSIKSGCYNKRGGILFIMESSIIVFTWERLFMLFICVGLFMFQIYMHSV
jgi:hypothetical protein